MSIWNIINVPVAIGEHKMSKHTFIDKFGTQYVTDRFMAGPALHAGYWWNDEAPLGAGFSVWREVVRPHNTDGKLFGYDAREFMAKQYK
jgi:hypothetical protein